ncbi:MULTISPECIES: alpha/beta fold hydrolase [Gammaproteobacteria]|jgi:pimeloyl-ACP methyl ester carboxylesterase|uniref:Alpha/beta hydrolase fold protein n=1 Tax=Paraglaciecola polaris LMG 21857 TaxID=1129793 RepID=K7ADS7_9ALTE|nr:alpha/beta hydrolase [Paraglaciecola polaris]GAC33480.1 alpha/beta hydrolase fold protein [Paraglaciecola polaris LMG 21857]|tara:strand:- start:2594 stop:3478 length:885 start_codon:yes stop_codon:yes gene_type:complete
MKEGRINANGLDFTYLEEGSGPLALCVHGFPDSPYSFRHLMPELAKAGYRAVAPFIRGYAPTAIPENGDYSTKTRAADFNALHEALGGAGDAVLIAHDWGAVAAYGALAAEPNRWSSAAIMSVPPLAIFGNYVFQYEQIKRSFYFWFFQMDISEAIVAMDNFAFIDGLWADWSPGYDASEDLYQVKKCFSNPANLRAAMAYYRDLFNPSLFGMPDEMEKHAAVWGQPISQPALYLHGTNDGCIALDDAGLKDVVNYLGVGSKAEWVKDVGHFLVLQKPEEVNQRILQFLKTSKV